MRAPFLVAAALGAALIAPAAAGAAISAPSGVRVDTVATGVGQPTNIAFDEDGGIWTTSGGNTTAASDGVWFTARPDAEPVHAAGGIFHALGLRWRGEELFVSFRHPYRFRQFQEGRVVAYGGFDGRRFARRRTVLKDIPVGRHSLDSIVEGPGGRLYMGVGSQHDARGSSSATSATVVSFRPSGRDLRVEARGLRNPYGLAFIPGTRSLLVTDNGRDDLGRSRPNEELNLIRDVSKSAPDFGFPRCYNQGGRACRGKTPPLAKLPPHASSDGLAVAERFGSYGLSAFIAQNGSSFPSNPTGHDVLRVALERVGGTRYRARVHSFARGFERFDPLGAAIGPDGALYVTLYRSGRVVRFSP